MAILEDGKSVSRDGSEPSDGVKKEDGCKDDMLLDSSPPKQVRIAEPPSSRSEVERPEEDAPMTTSFKPAQVQQPHLGHADDEDETGGLEALGASIRDQDDLERNINQQADQLLVKQANARDRKRLEKAEREKR